MVTPFTKAPSLADLEAIAAAEFDKIPAQLRAPLGPVVIRIEDFPTEDVEAEMNLESPFDLLGLYQGVALPQQSVAMVRTAPDMIFLYRRPILDYWCEQESDLTALIRHVLIHEIGHHFGFSDEEMDRIEAQ